METYELSTSSFSMSVVNTCHFLPIQLALAPLHCPLEHPSTSPCKPKMHSSLPSRDGNGAGSGRISAGFGSSGFGDDSSPTVFGFVASKSIGFEFGFGFLPVDTQWITVSNENSCFIVYLIITLFI